MSVFAKRAKARAFRVHTNRYDAAAYAHYDDPHCNVAVLKYAREIVALQNSASPSDLAISSIFDAAVTVFERGAFCMDCLHPECLLVTDILVTAREVVERHQRHLPENNLAAS